MLLKDARDFQILFLSTFLILGIATRDWTLKPEFILTAILTCLLTQWAAENIILFKDDPQQLTSSDKFNLSLPNILKIHSWRSALITSLGLSLLLRTNDYSVIILASLAAIISKFIFKFRDKHFFNPANFGIILVLILTPNAWVSPGQWGDDWWCLLLFAGTGSLILKRVGRWDTTATFLISYALLEAIRNFMLGWTWDVFWHRLMSGSLLLFALFMLTDPRSIPNARISRLIWATCIALLTFVMRNQFFISPAIFWALFILSPLTIILDLFWSAPRFSWFNSIDVTNKEAT